MSEVIFAPAADGVAPGQVPQRTLYTGAKVPAIGLGTFGSDHAGAAEVDYCHFDCAAATCAALLATR